MMSGCAVMSSIVCILCVSGPMPNGSIQRDIALAILSPIFIVWNILSLRRHYFYLHGIAEYYKVNLCDNIMFVLISVAFYICGSQKVYSWLFLATLMLRFSSIGITSIASILLFHASLVISVFIAIIGMGWVEEDNKEREELLERVPGVLTVNPLEKKDDSTEVPKDEKENKDEREKDTFSQL